ncbi:MAG: hypothetical protein ACR2OI_02965 [Acidimicrobiia bacterium]
MALIDTLLLLALPASGKSELRRYLETRPEGELAELNLKPSVQLDDYPYVHLMRRVSQELRKLGEDPVFFAADDGEWLEPRDWGVLIQLVGEDYASLEAPPAVSSGGAASWLLDRFDRARHTVGAPGPFASMDPGTRGALCAAIEAEAAEVVQLNPVDVATHTVVVEFARGGPDGAEMPLPAPQGYGYSLAQLPIEILESAVILYVWVDPAESRRRNRERARPGLEGDASILHHGVPESVMRDEYGTDDIAWLIDTGERPGTVTVEAHGRRFHLPIVRFDNRVDRTSFLRDSIESWDPDAIAALHDILVRDLASLAD